jgi:GTP-binding protein YchF
VKVGIVGMPGAGKTTLFQALTGLNPGQGRKTVLGVIKVPDPRVDRLASLYRPRKTTYAEIAFVDQASDPGLAPRPVLDAERLSAIREADALCQVVRAFDDPSRPEPATPVAEARALWTEMLLDDQALIERRLERLRKERSHCAEQTLLTRLLDALENEQPLRLVTLSPDESRLLSGYRFLTRKPLLVVLNIAEQDLGRPVHPELEALSTAQGARFMRLSCQIEMEVERLPAPEQRAFLEALGLPETARSACIRAAYALCDLIPFFTVGEDEVRAWTIRRGTPAVRAAGKIHSDLERGFIRAEVIAYEDRIALGSEARCREAGKLRLEGKDYLIQDGDIVHIRFNA